MERHEREDHDHTRFLGGYGDIKFLDSPPDSLLCPVCLLVLKEPHLLSCCGAQLCEVCIGRVKANGQSCPCCRDEEYVDILDKRTRGKILSLRVHCGKDVCVWEGELGDLGRHHDDDCKFVELSCEYGCGQSYPRHTVLLHQLHDCPQRPLHVVVQSYQEQTMEKLTALQNKYDKMLLEKEKEHKVMKQQLEEQEKKHKEDKKMLQQQLAQQEKKHEKLQQQLAQQEKIHEKDKKTLQQQLAQLEKKQKEEQPLQQLVRKKELKSEIGEIQKRIDELSMQLQYYMYVVQKEEMLQQHLAQQEEKHEEDKKELQQQLEEQEKELQQREEGLQSEIGEMRNRIDELSMQLQYQIQYYMYVVQKEEMLQQHLAQQEEKHEEDKKELQQQLEEQEKELQQREEGLQSEIGEMRNRIDELSMQLQYQISHPPEWPLGPFPWPSMGATAATSCSCRNNV